MGGCRSLWKDVIREVRKEITPKIFRHAGYLVRDFEAMIGDGLIDGDEAKKLGRSALMSAHAITKAAAESVLLAAHRQVNQLQVPPKELGVDDFDEPEDLSETHPGTGVEMEAVAGDVLADEPDGDVPPDPGADATDPDAP